MNSYMCKPFGVCHLMGVGIAKFLINVNAIVDSAYQSNSLSVLISIPE